MVKKAKSGYEYRLSSLLTFVNSLDVLSIKMLQTHVEGPFWISKILSQGIEYFEERMFQICKEDESNWDFFPMISQWNIGYLSYNM